MTMLIHWLLIVLVLLSMVGLLLWGVGKIPGIPEIVKTIVLVIVGLILLGWLLKCVESGHLWLPQ